MPIKTKCPLCQKPSIEAVEESLLRQMNYLECRYDAMEKTAREFAGAYKKLERQYDLLLDSYDRLLQQTPEDQKQLFFNPAEP